MTDNTLTLVVIASIVVGLATGFFLSRWHRKRETRIARAALEAARAQATEQLSWKRGCGGAGDVTD